MPSRRRVAASVRAMLRILVSSPRSTSWSFPSVTPRICTSDPKRESVGGFVVVVVEAEVASGLEEGREVVSVVEMVEDEM